MRCVRSRGIPIDVPSQIVRTHLRNAAIALAVSCFASGVGTAILIALRHEGWVNAFLVPIAIYAVGILLPLIAAVRLSRGGGPAWFIAAIFYLALHVVGDVSLPLFAVLLKWPMNGRILLGYLFEFQFVCIWLYAIRTLVRAS